MKAKTQVSIASDYAVLAFDQEFPYFYFGYEVTYGGNEEGEDADWCFQAKFSKADIVTIPQPHLGLEDGLEMGEYLLAGIGLLVERGILERSKNVPGRVQGETKGRERTSVYDGLEPASASSIP